VARWENGSSVASLRSLLGDGPSDKFEFRTSAVPAPDGVTCRFFLGRQRLVEDSVVVYENSVSGAPTIGAALGTADFLTAPAPSGTVEASYFYQWFTDPELLEFLTLAANTLRFESSADAALPVGLRPALLDFACYHAYMRKAAEYAEALSGSANGFEVNQGHAHPNWRSLAEAAFKNAAEKVKQYAENPLGAKLPRMCFVSYQLEKW